MPAEAPPPSPDDLFGSTKPTGSGTRVHACPSCGKRHEGTEVLRFCAACGAPLHADGQVFTVRVLVADDALISRRKITAILKRLACPTLEAGDGRQALDLARREHPDLIVLDVHMPQMTGLQVLEALRADASFATTPILMLTGEADANVVRQALTRGANDYIRKGSSPKELEERLNKHVQALRARG